jgi:hypothetical protein
MRKVKDFAQYARNTALSTLHGIALARPEAKLRILQGGAVSPSLNSLRRQTKTATGLMLGDKE